MQETDQSKRPVSRRLKITLGLSLALNLAVVGVIAGAMVRHGEGGAPGARHASFGAYGLPYVIALSRSDRRALGREVRSGAGWPDRATRRAHYDEVLGALRATPFDKDALAGTVARQAETTIAVQKTAQSAWLEMVAGMSDGDRRAYADAVEQVLNRGPKGRK